MDAVAKSWLSRRVQALIVPGSALVAELCTCSDPKLGFLKSPGIPSALGGIKSSILSQSICSTELSINFPVNHGNII